MITRIGVWSRLFALAIFAKNTQRWAWRHRPGIAALSILLLAAGVAVITYASVMLYLLATGVIGGHL